MEAKLDVDGFSRAAAQVPSCALDREGLEQQHQRHRLLSPSVVQMRREGRVLRVEFAVDFDSQTLTSAACWRPTAASSSSALCFGEWRSTTSSPTASISWAPPSVSSGWC